MNSNTRLGRPRRLAVHGGCGARFQRATHPRSLVAIGVDARERTELVVRGTFRLVRNPVFSLQLTAVGLALLCSTPLAWIACAVQLLALELQVRGVGLAGPRGRFGAAALRTLHVTPECVGTSSLAHGGTSVEPRVAKWLS